jgi:hypothetical protein
MFVDYRDCSREDFISHDGKRYMLTKITPYKGSPKASQKEFRFVDTVQ